MGGRQGSLLLCFSTAEQWDYFDGTFDLGLLSFSPIHTQLLLKQLRPSTDSMRQALVHGVMAKMGSEISCPLHAHSGRSDPTLPLLFCNEGSLFVFCCFPPSCSKGVGIILSHFAPVDLQ